MKRTALTRRTQLARNSELVRSTGLKPGGSGLKRTPLGHASDAQREKVAREGCRIPEHPDLAGAMDGLKVDPAHVTPRPHGGCDDPLCVVGLYRGFHQLYDEGKLDLLPYLTLEEQAHAVGHLGVLGALKRTTGEHYVPEHTRLRVIDGGSE